jgi:hypothetical protein
VDSDDDCNGEDNVPSDSGNQPSEAADECKSPPDEPELMKLSNAALQAELKKRNQSTNGNKTVMMQRLLTGLTKRLPGNKAIPRSQNSNEEGRAR